MDIRSHLLNKDEEEVLTHKLIFTGLLLPSMILSTLRAGQNDSSKTIFLQSNPAVMVDAVKIRATPEVWRAWLRELNRGIQYPTTGQRLSDLVYHQVSPGNTLDRSAPSYCFFASPDPQVKKKSNSN
jgi:hypothetical protein